MNYFTLGNLNFAVTGDGPVPVLIREELASICCDHSIQPDLAFDWTDPLPSIQSSTFLPPYRIASNAYDVRQPELDYHVSATNGRWDVVLKPSNDLGSSDGRSNTTLGEAWQRFRDWNYLSNSESIAKAFMYDVFDYVSQCCQIEKAQTYLHASSMTRGQRGVVIAGWGGVGKTTSILKLVAEHGWKYLSDDLALVCSNGNLFRHPKRIQIYAYNLVGQPLLKDRLLRNRGAADRLSWNIRRCLRGVKGVRRRISAEDFFGPECVGHSAKTTDIFLMERADCSSIEVRPIELERAVDRMTATLLHELSPFADVNSACRAGGLQIGFPAIETAMARTTQILTSAFQGIQPFLVRVPPKTGPDELSQVLLKHLN